MYRFNFETICDFLVFWKVVFITDHAGHWMY